jgi:predicted nucleic acid-binding protein
MNEIFIDSNIILYLMDSDEHKRSIAQNILLKKPCINSQVLTEVANVCKRRFKYEKEQILRLWDDLLSDCFFVPSTKTTFHTAIALTKKYNFQLFDALIVASALDANCNTLYSEDMQHKMIIENKLTIINPFLSEPLI